LLTRHAFLNNHSQIFTPKINFMRKFTQIIFLITFVFGMLSAPTFAQVSLTPGGAAYIQSFDNFTTTVPPSGSVVTASTTLP